MTEAIKSHGKFSLNLLVTSQKILSLPSPSKPAEWLRCLTTSPESPL